MTTVIILGLITVTSCVIAIWTNIKAQTMLDETLVTIDEIRVQIKSINKLDELITDGDKKTIRELKLRHNELVRCVEEIAKKQENFKYWCYRYIPKMPEDEDETVRKESV